MPSRPQSGPDGPIPCTLLPETKERIEKYAEELRNAAPGIGTHGLSPEEFASSGLFKAAIERLRGQQAATISVKRQFVEEVLKHLKTAGRIDDFAFVGSRERHDYEIVMPDKKMVIVEAKGSMDGNNTNIFQRPPNADEFYV